MHRLSNKQIQYLDDGFEDGNADRDSLYNVVKNQKVSRAQVSDYLRNRKIKKLRR